MWYAAMAQLVEHILGKDEVPGPNPGSSSRQPRRETFGALVFYKAFAGDSCGSAFLFWGCLELLPGAVPAMDTPSLRDELSPEESTGLFTVRIRVAAQTFSLRLGHARGKTVINCFLTLSRRYATPEVTLWGFGFL